jgi:hypothetical protein
MALTVHTVPVIVPEPAASVVVGATASVVVSCAVVEVSLDEVVVELAGALVEVVLSDAFVVDVAAVVVVEVVPGATVPGVLLPVGPVLPVGLEPVVVVGSSALLQDTAPARRGTATRHHASRAALVRTTEPSRAITGSCPHRPGSRAASVGAERSPAMAVDPRRRR